MESDGEMLGKRAAGAARSAAGENVGDLNGGAGTRWGVDSLGVDT